MPGAIVMGGGVAATAIAEALADAGFQVELVFPTYGEGSSYTNQKWKHSGLLYPDYELAKKAWEEMKRGAAKLESYIQNEHPATFFALRETTIKERENWWEEWSVKDWGLNWRKLDQSELAAIPVLEGASPAGGFAVPDYAIDFPRLIKDSHQKLVDKGHKVTNGGAVTKLIIDQVERRVTGCEVLVNGRLERWKSDLFVLAAGAWSKTIIKKSNLLWPDLILRKCIILVFDGELVPSITTCLDIHRHRKGEIKDVTLVPMGGKTLAAGTGFVEIDSMDDDLSIDDHEFTELLYELEQAFPQLCEKDFKAHVCVKTETRPGGKANVAPRVFGREEFGLKNFLFAIPGKASFMYDVARSVINSNEVRAFKSTHP